MFNRLPTVYKNDLCPACKTTKKTNTHVFICLIRQKLSITKLINAILKAVTPFSTTKEATIFINTYLKPSNLFKIDYTCINSTAVTDSSTFSITDTFHFLILKSLVRHIRKHLKQNKINTKLIISKIT